MVRRTEPGRPAAATRPAAAWSVLASVMDPEIPVLSVVDLGIVRDLTTADGAIDVDLAPTYTGCPAVDVIERDVAAALAAHGFDPVRIRRVLAPPWTTDWISAAGRRKLRDYGIAPPPAAGSKRHLLAADRPAACPHCRSTDTSRTSEFGSTPCKAAWRCNACREPFEYFKCI
ncbi:MAG TPA: 1,2-phenylacetyl-CoA epoxidase subunit PaaD [Woeseiaceae bacterium]|nr:1,2-phenylacetyl-CoA epoxidase subunit PaaD [Woeseiaceae bacterium]